VIRVTVTVRPGRPRALGAAGNGYTPNIAALGSIATRGGFKLRKRLWPTALANAATLAPEE
jgi:hypothetical protein